MLIQKQQAERRGAISRGEKPPPYKKIKVPERAGKKHKQKEKQSKESFQENLRNDENVKKQRKTQHHSFSEQGAIEQNTQKDLHPSWQARRNQTAKVVILVSLC